MAGIAQEHAWVHMDEPGKHIGGCRPTRSALRQMARDSGNYYDGCITVKIHGAFRFPREMFFHET